MDGYLTMRREVAWLGHTIASFPLKKECVLKKMKGE
jgi:hypothetical protein